MADAQNNINKTGHSRPLRKIVIGLGAILVLVLVALAYSAWAPVAYERLQVGDELALGRYPQGSAGEVNPINWQVLRRDSDGLWAISQVGLEAHPFYEEWDDIDWEHSTLRRWLNEDFVSQAFNAQEQQQLLTVALNATGVASADAPSTEAVTRDKVFLLSASEAETLFASPEARRCRVSPYLIAQKAFVYQGVSNWWLRTPGMSAQHAAYVSSNGLVKDDMIVNSAGVCLVRPVIKVSF